MITIRGIEVEKNIMTAPLIKELENTKEDIIEMTNDVNDFIKVMDKMKEELSRKANELKELSAKRTALVEKKDKLENAIILLNGCEASKKDEVKEEKKDEVLNYENQGPIITMKDPKKSNKELIMNFKTAKIGMFDSHGNQIGLFCSQRRVAEHMGVSQPTVGYILKNSSEEDQIKKRGFYLKYVH